MKLNKTFLKQLEKFVLYLNLGFAAFLLLTYLSPLISPEKFWPLAFLGLGYIILLCINLLFCVYWIIRLKKYFFISALSILAGINVLLNTFGFNYFRKPITSASKTSLKLMTYNVHNFNRTDTPGHFHSYKLILGLIESNQPDIIGFEEFNSKISLFRICDSLKKTMNTDQFFFAPFVKTPADSTGLALLSKYPIIDRGIIRFSDEQNENQAIYADIKYNSKIFRVYAFHLQSVELSEKEYRSLNNLGRRRAIGLTGLHQIEKKMKVAFIKRGKQVGMIREHAANCPYPYVFMGDFNDTPSSYTFNQMAKGMKNAFREKGAGLGKTFSDSFAGFQIDYILTSKQFNILDYKIIPKVISDHYPVLSTVLLN